MFSFILRENIPFIRHVMLNVVKHLLLPLLLYHDGQVHTLMDCTIDVEDARGVERPDLHRLSLIHI